MQIHQSAEDYLETILMLSQRMGKVRSIDVVNELGFTKASVSIAMKKLRENGYIAVDGEGNLTLLAPGREIAERIYSRHRLLTHFFMQLGVDEKIASFVLPLGMTINMNGTAVYMGVCTVFAAQIYGIDLSLSDQIIVVITGVLAAVGTAGVPGAGLIMSTLVFTQIGIPLEVIALIAGVDRILDMIRTSINVVGDSTTALAVTRSEGEFGTEPFEEN